jgi:hypothetical protein
MSSHNSFAHASHCISSLGSIQNYQVLTKYPKPVTGYAESFSSLRINAILNLADG